MHPTARELVSVRSDFPLWVMLDVTRSDFDRLRSQNVAGDFHKALKICAGETFVSSHAVMVNAK